ncbi:MAG: HDOD domain-containing protein [Gemmatimonadetes bacterium]|nr:HDOD domain-containing protein [Gemmatimonadota bacterium]
MSDVFLARQPIFDKNLQLAGYELLYRANAMATTAGARDSVHMSSNTIVNSILAIGLDDLIGEAKAWVNFPLAMLLERNFDLLDPKRCVIELLETIPCDEDTVTATKELHARGFTIALDDFIGGDEYAPMLEMAHVIKLDVLGRGEQEIDSQIRQLGRYRAKLLAERVETASQFAMCRKLGFSLFQGYYFSRPEIVQRRDLSPAMAAIAQLMNKVLDQRVSERELERIFRQDPGLSLKLLKIVNTASMGGSGIESIAQAIRLVGRQVLHRWLALIMASSAPRANDMDKELITRSLERARLCEQLAELSGRKAAAPSLFLTGLLSTFDVVLGIPMPELLQQVKVAPEVEAALLHHEGPYTPYLQLATHWADGDWDQATPLADLMGVLTDVPTLYRHSCEWAREVLAA